MFFCLFQRREENQVTATKYCSHILGEGDWRPQPLPIGGIWQGKNIVDGFYSRKKRKINSTSQCYKDIALGCWIFFSWKDSIPKKKIYQFENENKSIVYLHGEIFSVIYGIFPFRLAFVTGANRNLKFITGWNVKIKSWGQDFKKNMGVFYRNVQCSLI